MRLIERGLRKVEQKLQNIRVTNWVGEIPSPNKVKAKLKSAFANDEALAVACESTLEFLKQADIVEVYGGSGIGDCVMNMRYARIIAANFPDKQFYVRLNSSLVSIDNFQMPENCVLEDKRAQPSRRDSYYLDLFFSSQSVKEVAKILTKEVPHFAYFDLHAIAKLQEYGIDPTIEEIAAPLLSFSQEHLDSIDQDLDLLIAPDAKEMEVTTEKPRRSAKSLAPYQWKPIFGKIPSGSKIGIIVGVEHAEYSRLVAELAQIAGEEHGFSVEVIETDTLSEFIDQVLRTKHFIGMDSGTTHLAFEVVGAALEAGRDIKLTQFFNARRFPPKDYALRGLPTQVQVLIESEAERDYKPTNFDFIYFDTKAAAELLFPDESGVEFESKTPRNFPHWSRG